MEKGYYTRKNLEIEIVRSQGSAIRDIRRKIIGQLASEEAFQWLLARAGQIRSQQQRQRGWKLYSFHAPEVECIVRAMPVRPMNSASRSRSPPPTPARPGGQFVLHSKALPGNPYDGHTLRSAIEDTERFTGREIERGYVDKDTAATMRQTHTVFSSLGRSAACSALSSASYDAAPPLSP